MKLAGGVAVGAALVALSVAGIGCRQAATPKQAELAKESLSESQNSRLSLQTTFSS
jgi:hypothetical protein